MARNVISVVSTGPVGPGGPPNNVGMMVGCQYYLYRGIGLVDEKRRRKGPARDDSQDGDWFNAAHIFHIIGMFEHACIYNISIYRCHVNIYP